MKNMIFDAFTSVASFLKRLPVARILVVFLASCLLLTTTACNTDSPDVVGTGSYDKRINQPTGLREYSDRADQKSRPDLNSYNDYGTYGTSKNDDRGIAEQTKERVRQADRNVEKAIESPKDYARNYREGAPLDERVRNLSEDVGSAAKQFQEDFAKGTKENVRNLKSNADKAGQNIQDAAS